MFEEIDIIAHRDDHVLTEDKDQSSNDEPLMKLQDAPPAGERSHMTADRIQTPLFDYARWPEHSDQPEPQPSHFSIGSNQIFYNQLPYPLEPVTSQISQQHQRYATNLSPQSVNRKRKRGNESEDRGQTSKTIPPHYVGPPAFFTPTMASDMLLAPSARPQDVRRPDLSEMLRSYRTPNAVSSSSPHTPPTGSTSGINLARYTSPAPTASITLPRSDPTEAVSGAKQDVLAAVVEKRDLFKELDFIPDLYLLDKHHFYFLTVGDRLKAEHRGFRTSWEVYSERLARPNIDTIDINLAWIPPPTYKNGAYPWHPICGPAAYIGLVKGDIKAQFRPEEDFYFQGQSVGHTLDLPMLHHIKTALWYQRQHCQTSYTGRQTHSDEKEEISFMPSQAAWTPQNLPPSAAILEPFKTGKTEVKSLVTRTGEVVKDKSGHPLRAFDHILPAKIPQSVEGWLIATWLAEDPRIQWRDIEARMTTSDVKASVRIRERYAKYRDLIGALSRDTNATSKRAPTKKDVKVVQQQSWERLAGNSWWPVDLELKRICQSTDPLKGYSSGKAVYPLPLSRTQKGEYSSRVQAAHQEPQNKLGADTEGVEVLERQQ